MDYLPTLFTFNSPLSNDKSSAHNYTLDPSVTRPYHMNDEVSEMSTGLNERIRLGRGGGAAAAALSAPPAGSVPRFENPGVRTRRVRSQLYLMGIYLTKGPITQVGFLFPFVIFSFWSRLRSHFYSVLCGRYPVAHPYLLLADRWLVIFCGATISGIL
ncbi:hypothetical protein GWI33_010122 [Rhynchophorus ferrugineus]|uniref:Uncharacterized protein n=1 Tax=Rhynchophorus ferrugineus TaxID=354439 RepID=A0A834ISJ6_RHYFE|nr:hypothetical protein GWI33_010122 [Rhynchophorus ferrugineus]